MAAHLLRGEPPPVAMDDAVDGLRILEAAARSAASGREEILEPRGPRYS